MADPTTSSAAHDPAPLSRILVAETREELIKADQKANLLLAAMGVAVAALIGAFASARVSPFSFPAWGQIPFWLGCVIMLAALESLARAVLPYPGSGKAGRMHYFGDVSENNHSWETALALASSTNLAERDIQQFVILAASVTNKYRWIRRGIFSAAIAVPLLFLGSLLGVTLD
ncbi:Pycsar system effector family protein [Streptomyces sp. NPDC007883]|uniref:Pycsar system effector family protein n=1 Tax=Streptomyces sp. NPDC007883 TaxID=3155116 RepID=UPI0033FC22BD